MTYNLTLVCCAQCGQPLDEDTTAEGSASVNYVPCPQHPTAGIEYVPIDEPYQSKDVDHPYDGPMGIFEDYTEPDKPGAVDHVDGDYALDHVINEAQRYLMECVLDRQTL